jgi:hypothetical protein
LIGIVCFPQPFIITQVDSMRHFRVLVLGEHFQLDREGSIRYMGFYVTRFVTEETEEEAIKSAIAAVSSEDKLEGLILNAKTDPPRLMVDELEEILEEDVPEKLPGYVFFREEEDSLTAEY